MINIFSVFFSLSLSTCPYPTYMLNTHCICVDVKCWKSQKSSDFTLYLKLVYWEPSLVLCSDLGWDKEELKGSDMYNYGWFVLLYGEKPDNTVKQFSPIKKTSLKFFQWHYKIFDNLNLISAIIFHQIPSVTIFILLIFRLAGKFSSCK